MIFFFVASYILFLFTFIGSIFYLINIVTKQGEKIGPNTYKWRGMTFVVMAKTMTAVLVVLVLAAVPLVVDLAAVAAHLAVAVRLAVGNGASLKHFQQKLNDFWQRIIRQNMDALMEQRLTTPLALHLYLNIM